MDPVTVVNALPIKVASGTPRVTPGNAEESQDMPMTRIRPAEPAKIAERIIGTGTLTRKRQRGRRRLNRMIASVAAALEKDNVITVPDGIPGNEQGESLGGDDRTKFVVRWLCKTYEASENTSMPRSSVFAAYMEECKKSAAEPVNPATFGKLIRAVFPELKTRRLGTRGHSKYHYFGIAPMGTAAALAEGRSPTPTCTVTAGPKRKTRVPFVDQGNCDQDVTIAGLRARPAAQPIINPLRNDAVPYHPLIPDYEEFARFVEQICQPIPEKIQRSTSLEAMKTFSAMYQNHISHLLRLISVREFPMVEMALGMFWNGLPKELWPCLHSEEGIRIISIADDYLFQVAIHLLVPDILEPLPLLVAQSIRYFAKSLEIWMAHVFDANVPVSIVEAKMDVARRFCQVLRRRTSLNHLVQAVRAILASSEHVTGMMHDFTQLDFGAIREQLHWVLPGQESFLAYVEASFKNYLFEGASLPQWAQWLDSMVEQSLAVDNCVLQESCRHVMLRWSFFTTMLMRDLTLRSANSFGSYHLLRLMFDEYVMHTLEKKLDEHRRAMGLLSYWPAQPGPAGHMTTQPEYETAMAGFASMDELFRKSGLLAYSQPSGPSGPATPTTPKARS